MSADDPTHLDVEGEAAEAQPCEGSGTLVRAEEEAPILCPVCAHDFGPAPPRADRQFVIPEHVADTEIRDQNLIALQNRARDLSLAITNPATLARKLRESLIELVGPEQSRAYHIGASYDSTRGEVQFQIATVTPNFLARLQVERGIGAATGAGSSTGMRAQLEVAYQRTINGWEVAVGAGVSAYAERGGGVMEAARMLKERQGDDVQVGASFSVTVRR